MQTTTQLALREILATTIEATTPGDDFLPTEVWKRVRGVREIEGPGIRTFLLRTLPGEPVQDGIYGDGMEWRCEVQVWTSYAGLADDEDGPIIDEDSRQLYCRMVDMIDPTTDGFVAVEPAFGWQYEDDAPGKAYGYHRYLVRYLVSDQA
jgi:hypothetical protein